MGFGTAIALFCSPGHGVRLHGHRDRAEESGGMSESRSIKGMEVPIIVQLGQRSMTVREVIDLAPGSIIELPMKVEDELSLYVSNKPIGQGTAVKIGENFGIQITFIGDLRARLAAATSFTIGSSREEEEGPSAEAQYEAMMAAGQL
ncbi:MAG: flagellar motor switch protein FliN/FliY [Phycisphaerales bacterium]